jgi:hypothetical protein
MIKTAMIPAQTINISTDSKEAVFLEMWVFRIISLISGSIREEIMNAKKNGARKKDSFTAIKTNSIPEPIYRTPTRIFLKLLRDISFMPFSLREKIWVFYKGE